MALPPMFRPLVLFKTNSDLANYQQRQSGIRSLSELRKRIPIAVIDDERFVPEENLRSHGYNLTQVGDIKRINEIQDYQIVLCDLMGVGKYFDSTRQGAGLIEEIRSHYPSVIVVAYSGASLGSGPARAAKERADKTIRKDADISDWRATLDELIQNAADPHFIWLRTRERLTQLNLDTKVILILEDAYVRTIESRDPAGMRLSRGLNSMNVSPDVRGVVQGLIASVIFKALFGG